MKTKVIIGMLQALFWAFIFGIEVMDTSVVIRMESPLPIECKYAIVTLNIVCMCAQAIILFTHYTKRKRK